MTIFLYLLAYLIVPQTILMVSRMVKDRMKAQMMGRSRSSTALKTGPVKEGFNRKLSKRVKFTMKDPRKTPVPRKTVFIVIYALGAAVALIGGFLAKWTFIPSSILIAYIAFGFAYKSADALIKKREDIMERMLDVKSHSMKLVTKGKGEIPTPNDEFKILDWGEDLVTPKKIHLYMPTSFDYLEIESFLSSFNKIFGSNGQWISNENDEEYKGFDFNAGVASIAVTPPLPQRADWHERYLNPKDIHWSFFPLALGAENGVPVYNEELDRVEHVLGFAVNGGQEKLSAKNGVTIGPEVTSSPQVLIAGGTRRKPQEAVSHSIQKLRLSVWLTKIKELECI